MWIRFIWLTAETLVRFCEHGSELSSNIKVREFLDHLRNYQLLIKDCAPCSSKGIKKERKGQEMNKRRGSSNEKLRENGIQKGKEGLKRYRGTLLSSWRIQKQMQALG